MLCCQPFLSGLIKKNARAQGRVLPKNVSSNLPMFGVPSESAPTTQFTSLRIPLLYEARKTLPRFENTVLCRIFESFLRLSMNH